MRPYLRSEARAEDGHKVQGEAKSHSPGHVIRVTAVHARNQEDLQQTKRINKIYKSDRWIEYLHILQAKCDRPHCRYCYIRRCVERWVCCVIVYISHGELGGMQM